MATVYLAQDLKHHRRVAIKVLGAEVAAAIGPDRFLREIEIAARLSHPHILPLHDSGNADGFLYYVMPYVEGDSLRQRLLREKQLPLQDALRITGAVASALSYAHSHDVVHRDIKPENILLSGGEAVVADFGIARAITAAGGDKLTTTGVAVGTPMYMSPEQAAGGAQLDGRSDVYSLGCVLYEMLAGEPPFTGPTPLAIIARTLRETPRLIHPMRAGVPEALDAVVAKAMAITPADRYTSAAEFARALGPVSGEMRTVTAPGVSAVRQVVRQRPLLAMLAVGLALGVLGWWAIPGRTRASSRRIDRIAVLPIENTTGDSAYDYLADGLTRELIAALTGAKVRVVGFRSVSRYRGGNLPLAKIANELHVEAVAVGSLLRGGNDLQLAMELTNPGTSENIWAETYLTTAAGVPDLSNRVARGAIGAMHAGVDSTREPRPQRTTRVNPEAYALYLRGKAETERYTLQGYRLSIEDFEHAVAIDSTFAPAWAGLGYALVNGAYLRLVQAAEGHARAQTAIDRALLLDSTLGLAHVARALLYADRDWNWSEADREFRTAIALAPTSEAFELYGWFLSTNLGRFNEAVQALEKAVQIDPTSGLMHEDLAQRLIEAGQRDRAREEMRFAMTVDSGFPETEEIRAVIQGLDGQFDSALAAVSRYESSSGVPDAGLRGNLLARAGRTVEATTILRELERRAKREGRLLSTDRAMVLLGLGRPDSAIALLGAGVDQHDAYELYSWWSQSIRSDPRFQAVLRRAGVAR